MFKVGDVVVCGMVYGCVKVMYDILWCGLIIDEVGLLILINLIGFDLFLVVGDCFVVLDEIVDVWEIVESRFYVMCSELLVLILKKVLFEDF